ncbi:hypothetical protein QQS21_011523 [Conoideocrella luteorostrata]|uniref:Uncharacterized protein n=1 Tax=Conoideocrella luteorostrata TaxID=1105319 RepID=A0AAJ0FNA8_9HYPO|nr:hypothetical protein QQS21_011523 [Conoideocrella luteorostrata]
MFLHAGASLHGHEYSSKKPPSSPFQPAKRGSLLQTALRPLATPSDTSDIDYFVTSPYRDLASSRRASSDDTYHRPVLATRHRTASSSLTRKDLAVRFREPGMEHVYTPSASEDEESIAGSELTDGTTDTPARRKKHRRMPRKSTRYALAQPAPQLRTKQRHLVQIRPRLLLQFQEIGDRRAIPAFDLIPSHLVAGTLIIPKLAKRFPRIFHANAELSQNDVLLVRSDDYGLTSVKMPLPSPDDDRGSRHEKEIWAVISALPKGCENNAEIVLEDGLSWRASPMANGSYEFTQTNETGERITARWVRRSNIASRNSFASFEPSASTRSSIQDQSQDSRWTFSTIDPSSRRHPIMGSLTAEALEVYDNYTTLSTSSGRFPPSRPFGPETSAHPNTSPAGFNSEPRRTLEVLPEQKALMIATASWIRLHQQGWPASSNPKFAKAIPSHCRSASGNIGCTIRRQTFPSYDGDDSRAASPLNRPHAPDSMQVPLSSKRQHQPGIPERALSTGRAFMKRRSDRIEGLATVHSQEVPLSVYQQEKLDIGELERPSCLGRMRHWTHRLFHRRKESSQ